MAGQLFKLLFFSMGTQLVKLERDSVGELQVAVRTQTHLALELLHGVVIPKSALVFFNILKVFAGVLAN